MFREHHASGSGRVVRRGRFPEAFEVDFKGRIEFQQATFQQWPCRYRNSICKCSEVKKQRYVSGLASILVYLVLKVCEGRDK